MVHITDQKPKGENKFKDILKNHFSTMKTRINDADIDAVIRQIGLDRINELVKPNEIAVGPHLEVNGYITPLHELLAKLPVALEAPSTPPVTLADATITTPRPSENPRELEIVTNILEQVLNRAQMFEITANGSTINPKEETVA